MKLAVFVPGLRSRPAAYRTLLERLGRDLGDEWRIEVFVHGIEPWTTGALASYAHRLSVQIRTWAGDNGVAADVDEVLLVGHSMGGLLLRHAYLLDAGATGEPGHGTFDWTAKVRRIVLLAAPNAGFRTDRMEWWRRAGYALLTPFRAFVVEELQAGSPYITELRLRWVAAFRSGARPQVVQVLGDRDNLVARDDSLDVEYMPNAMRVDVPATAHGDLVQVSAEPDDERYAVVRHAVVGELDRELLDATPQPGGPVYFLLHGIRAGRYSNWVGDLGESLTAADPSAVVHTPSYGYLSALEFAVPFTRSRNLRTFLDWYSRLYVTHDTDRLHFAGHSNGTYLFGRAMAAVPAMRFRRVYLAGSVLPRNYPWSLIESRGQVTHGAHSDRATFDLPVGWLCAALRGLRMRDIGTGGFAGFDQTGTVLYEHRDAFRGGHGAALSGPARVAEVAAILRGDDDVTGHQPDAAPAAPVALVSRAVGVLALPIVVAVCYALARWAHTASGWSSGRLGVLAGGVLALLAVGRAV